MKTQNNLKIKARVGKICFKACLVICLNMWVSKLPVAFLIYHATVRVATYRCNDGRSYFSVFVASPYWIPLYYFCFQS